MKISLKKWWIGSLIFLLAGTTTALWAEGAPASAPAPAHPAGFFETHYILTELLVLSILTFLLIISMASDTTTERITIRHGDNWGFPLGQSVIDFRVPTTPFTPKRIRRELVLFFVFYCSIRLTCMASVFTAIYQGLGSMLDIFFGH